MPVVLVEVDDKPVVVKSQSGRGRLRKLTKEEEKRAYAREYMRKRRAEKKGLIDG